MATTATEAATEPKPGLVDAVRAFGVMLGGSVTLVGAAAGSAGSAVRSLARRRRPHPLAVAGTVGVASYAAVVHPWLTRWGCERRRDLEAAPRRRVRRRRRPTNDARGDDHAPVEEVWPWLAQVGQDRGGFYSDEWLENLAGCRMTNTSRIHPEWQQRDVGETVKLHWASGLKVTRFEPNRVYALGGWYFVVEPSDGRTRLLCRTRFPRGVAEHRVRAPAGTTALHHGAEDAARNQGPR